MLPSHIVRVLTFFDLWCYNTGASALSNRRKLRVLILFLHIAMAALITVCQFYLMIELVQLVGVIRMINETIQYGTAVCTCWLIILDAFLFRNEHRIFWSKLQRIDSNFCKQTSSFCKYLFILIEFFPITISIYVFSNFLKSFASSEVILAYLAVIVLSNMRIFYYIFCLDTIHNQLCSVGSELKALKRTLNQKMTRTLHVHNKQLKQIRDFHHCVKEMVDLLNEVFGWSQVAAVLFCFCAIVTDMNWVYAYREFYDKPWFICKYQIQIYT